MPRYGKAHSRQGSGCRLSRLEARGPGDRAKAYPKADLQLCLTAEMKDSSEHESRGAGLRLPRYPEQAITHDAAANAMLRNEGSGAISCYPGR